MNDNIMMALIIVYADESPNITLVTFPNDVKANKPKTTEGIPLKVWTIIKHLLEFLSDNLNLIKVAVLTPIGVAISTEKTVTNKVIDKGIQIEAFLSLKLKSKVLKILYVVNAGIDE